MSNRTTVVTVFALATIGFTAGLVGFGGGWLAHSPEREVVEVVRPPTAEELAELTPEPDQDELTLAQIRVAELERESAERAGRVNELEARIARGAEVGAELRAELKRLQDELYDAYLWTPGLRIAGGADEILMNIIAERTLGLPGEPRLDKGKAFKDL